MVSFVISEPRFLFQVICSNSNRSNTLNECNQIYIELSILVRSAPEKSQNVLILQIVFIYIVLSISCLLISFYTTSKHIMSYVSILYQLLANLCYMKHDYTIKWSNTSQPYFLLVFMTLAYCTFCLFFWDVHY